MPHSAVAPWRTWRKVCTDSFSLLFIVDTANRVVQKRLTRARLSGRALWNAVVCSVKSKARITKPFTPDSVLRSTYTNTDILYRKSVQDWTDCLLPTLVYSFTHPPCIHASMFSGN